METTTTPNKNRQHAIIALAIVALAALIILPTCQIVLMMTGSYTIDTVQFTLTDPATATSGVDGSTEPGIWIDTNIKTSLWSRTIKTSKPYHIAINKTDTSFTFASIEITQLKITYDDGSAEPNTPTLPYTIHASDYTETTTGPSGKLVKTKMYLINGTIPNTITRDEPFTLDMQGHFNLDDGNKLPFTIQQHYDVIIENTTKPASDVLLDK